MAILTAPPEASQEADPQPRSALYGIPDGAGGIRATLNAMARLTREYRTNPSIRAQAESIVANVPGKDWYGEIAAVQKWVRNNIRYTQDIYNVETLKSPLYLLDNPFGDCDDMSLLAGTLLQSLGFEVRYIAVGTEAPGEFNHVYPEVRYMSRWISVETTEPVPLGWTPAPLTAYMVARV